MNELRSKPQTNSHRSHTRDSKTLSMRKETLVLAREVWSRFSPDDIFEHYALRPKDHFGLFEKLLKDTDLEKSMGQSKFLEFINILRKEFLDNGNFGKKWLTGSQISSCLKSLQKKNKQYFFLQLVPFEIDIYLDKILNNLSIQLENGKKKFGIVQNHFFQTKNQRGTHWVSLFVDFKEQFIFYFDSTGQSQSKAFLDQSQKLSRSLKNNFPQLVLMFFSLLKGSKTIPNLSALQSLYQNQSLSVHQFQKTTYPRFTILHERELKEKQPLIIINSQEHQKIDGNCGTYAIFFQYLMCYLTRTKRIGEILSFLDKGIVTDSQMEEFKKKIFISLPQEITRKNLAAIRKSIA